MSTPDPAPWLLHHLAHAHLGKLRRQAAECRSQADAYEASARLIEAALAPLPQDKSPQDVARMLIGSVVLGGWVLSNNSRDAFIAQYTPPGASHPDFRRETTTALSDALRELGELHRHRGGST